MGENKNHVRNQPARSRYASSRSCCVSSEATKANLPIVLLPLLCPGLEGQKEINKEGKEEKERSGEYSTKEKKKCPFVQEETTKEGKMER